MNKKLFYKKLHLDTRNHILSLLLSFFLLLTLTNITLAQDSISFSDIYIIKKGDTLWDLSARFFGDPFVWPSLWKQNPHIKDPHWIYPGQIINLRNVLLPPFREPISSKIPSMQKKKKDFEEKMETPKIDISPEPQYVATEELINSCSYIIPNEIVPQRERIEGWGRIIKSKENKINLSYLDHIFIDLGSQKVKVGQPLTVFKVEGNMKSLPKIEQSYKMIRILGKAEVTEVYPNFSLARIIKSYSEINIGDFVKPYEAMPRPVLKLSEIKDIHGELIASEECKEHLSTYDIVFLNLGKRDGLEPGNPLDIYRFNEIPIGTVNKKTEKVVELLGVLFVLRVEERTSTGLISKTLLPIVLGDYVMVSSN